MPAGAGVLFQKRFHAGLRDGRITLSFRAWSRPQVRVGGRYRSPVGVLEVDGLERVRVRDIAEGDARRAGFENRAELVAYLSRTRSAGRERAGTASGRARSLRPDSRVYRIELHHAGEPEPGELPPAGDADLTPEDVASIRARLDRMDRASRRGAWTRQVLDLIRTHPRVAASRLAPRLGRETASFKADVRKLKRLGLTIAHETGYELSPRGRAFLSKAGRARRHPP